MLAKFFYSGFGTKKNVKKAMELFQIAANQYGDPEALNELGVMYEQGCLGGRPDYKKVLIDI